MVPARPLQPQGCRKRRWARTGLLQGPGVPERARKARVHSGNGGIAGDVRDLQTPSPVLGQLQHRVDVDTICRGVDGPDVIAGGKESR